MKLAEALALAPRGRAKRAHEEDDIQTAIVEYLRLVLDARRYVVFAIPNGGSRDAREAARMKRTGTLAGVFDIEIAGPGGQVWRIETKAASGSLTDPQKLFQRFLINSGAPFVIARSVADVEAAVAQWGLLNRRAA